MKNQHVITLEEKIYSFRQGVLNFWSEKGRKDLPWRKTTDPWKILLAEILLRKTTSQQVVDVYNDLSNKAIKEIAFMDNAELEKVLYPLGIYRTKTKQIKSIAVRLCNNGLNVLYDADLLKDLPGVGRYAINTVLCFAFLKPKPALDTNMIRIIQRVFEFNVRRSRAREDKELWSFAECLVPVQNCREFNWGVLDLGAFICKAKTPICDKCTLYLICNYNERC